MGDESLPSKSVFEKQSAGIAFREKRFEAKKSSFDPLASAVEALFEAGDWKSLLSSYSSKISAENPDILAWIVVISRDLQFRWTTHDEMLDTEKQPKYEELLPLNADFGDAVRAIKAPNSGILLVDEVALSTASSEFTLFRGRSRGNATLYLYAGGRRKLTEDELAAFHSVAIIFDSIIKREFSVGEQIAHAARLSAAIELGRQIGDSALASSFLNRAADTIQKKIGIDYVALMVLDEGKREVEFAGISESLTPLYDTPQSMKPGSVVLGALGQKDPLLINDLENSGYKPLGSGVKWACIVPLETHSKKNALLVLESRSISPYNESELKDIEIVSSLLSDRLSTSISTAEKDRRILFRNMLLEELLLLHRQSDPAKIAEESLSFIESAIPSTISVFYALNETRTTLIPVTSRGLFAEEMLSFAVPVGEGIVGKAISNDMPELINDAKSDLRTINMPGGSGEPEAILVVPIKSIKEDIGVITLHRSGKKGFSAEDLEVASTISRQLSTVMERANAAADMRKVVGEKEAESTLTGQIADEFISALAEERQETLPVHFLRKCTEVAACESGSLFIKLDGNREFRSVAHRPATKSAIKKEVTEEEIEALKRESIHLANNVYVLDDGYKVEDACDKLGICMDRNIARYEIESIRPYMVLYHEESVPGCESLFVGIGYQQAKSKQLFRGYLLQRLLHFFELKNLKMHDSKTDSDELLRTKKISYFKDVVYSETDLGRLFEKVVPIIGELVVASSVSIYLANYTTSSFDRASFTAYNGTPEPPPRMIMSQAGKLLSSLDAHKKVVRLGSETGDVPFSSLFSKPLLVGRISTMDGADYVVITAFEEESDISTADTQLAELLKALSSRARQLTALNQERQRTGLLNLIDEMARSIIKQADFGRMLDSISSAAGHLIGAEYSLVGFMNSSNIEWGGYYDARIPEAIERLAVKSVEKGEEIIMNDMSGMEIGPESDMPGSITNLMIFPITPKASDLPSVFVLLFNKLSSGGFNENDAWMLERLGSNIIGSMKTTEALKQEKMMKNRAELRKTELAELLDGIEGGVIRLDNEGNVSFANGEARRMFSISQVASQQKLVDLLSDTDSLQVIDFMDSVKKGEKFEGAYTFSVDGALKKISVLGKPINDHGRRKGTLLFTRDEGTLRQGMEKEGEKSQTPERHAEIRNIRFAIRRGFSYTISEDKPSVAFATLQDLLSAGFEALVISRDHPSRLTEKYKLVNSDLRWLTQVVGNNNLDPSKLSLITSAIISFLEKHQNAVIFIDGLEYLLANNNMIRVIAMLENVMQKVVDSGAVVLAAINRLTFDQKDLAMIGKMFEELDTGDLKKRYVNHGIEEFGEGKDNSSNIDAND